MSHSFFPIGPFRQVHHMERILDWFVDKNFSPEYFMNFIRSLVIHSEDCRVEFQKHESNIKKGMVSKYKEILYKVPFGYGVQDTFQIQLYSEKVKGEMKSAFL